MEASFLAGIFFGYFVLWLAAKKSEKVRTFIFDLIKSKEDKK